MPTALVLRLASYFKETRLRIRISWAASSSFQICRWLNVSRHAITQVKSPVHAPRFPDGLIPSTIFTTSHENWPDLLPSVESSINLYAEAVMEKYYLPSLKVNSSDGFITLRISPFFYVLLFCFCFFVFWRMLSFNNFSIHHLGAGAPGDGGFFIFVGSHPAGAPPPPLALAGHSNKRNYSY